MNVIKDSIVYIFSVIVVTTIFSIIGKYHPNIPVIGHAAALFEQSNYYIPEHFEYASIEDMKECMDHMNKLDKKLEKLSSVEAADLIDKEISFFKNKRAYVAVLRLTELKSLILTAN